MNRINIPKVLTFLLPLTLLIIIVFQNQILALLDVLPPCLFYTALHAYCPSCGNTRSVTALLQGDILTSLRFNLVPVYGSILLFLGYIELAGFAYGRRIILLPRKLSFYLLTIFLLVIYFIVRNFIPFLTP
ncbi:MAG: DUF2752 domain-containing protein [Mobilitalea sp.]